jgi:hypothetical protein
MIFALAAAAAMLFVGSRLLMRAWTNRALPELLLGGFFALVALTTPAISRTAEAGGMQLAGAQQILAIAHLGLSLAFGLLYAFTWISFGTQTPWRRALALFGGAGLVGSWLGQVVVEGFEAANGIATICTVAFRMIAVYWAFAEALVCYTRMRRRMRLGLADPVTTNRFLLWSVWTGLIATILLAVIVVRVILLTAPAGSVDPDSLLHTVQVFGAIGGITASAALWLNFFPPESYLQRLRGAAA